MGSIAAETKPLIVVGATPAAGHTAPIRALAKGLVQRGYDVTFITSDFYRKAMEDIGCSVEPIQGYGNYGDDDIETRWAERNSMSLPDQISYAMEKVFVACIPDQHAACQRAIEKLQQAHPGRPIVQINEGYFLGALPITKGARGIKPTGTMGLGIVPITLSSTELAPFGPGLPPASTDEQRAQYKEMTEQCYYGMLAKPYKLWQDIFSELGTEADSHFLDAPYLMPDRFLQLALPSVEYHRPDAPSSIRFAGGLPKGSRDKVGETIVAPPFWDEIVNNKEKKIIFVCQGTIATVYTDLIIPTMEALKDRDDLLVVAALGRKGAKLDSSFNIPANARVADFIPFDDILAHSTIFVTNGGYGGFQHGIANGVPMLMGGLTEDKAEVSARAEWAGVAYNLKTSQPTLEAIRAGVEDILTNPKYKQRALELEAESNTFSPLDIVIKNIEELAAGEHLK